MNRIWDILQIEPTIDKREIRKAYARLSKEIHPEEKLEEFQILYEAYQRALQYASSGKRPERYTVNFETDQEADDKPEDESVPEEQEQNRYKEFGLNLEEGQECQYDGMEEIAYFQHWWRQQVIVWLNGALFPDEKCIEYLQSEAFQKIMWSPVVLKIIAEGMGRYFQQNEKILLFFWDLYDFERKLGEENCNEESLLLCRKLYPAYTNYIRRQEYAKNKDKIQEEERKRIHKGILIGVCVVIGIALAILVLPYFKLLDGVLTIFLVAALLAVVFKLFKFLIWG